MDEYIKKEEALRVISDVFFETDPDGREQLTALKCSRLVRELPAADVAPVVHGRKIEDGDIGCFWLCSLCGECLPYGAKYCPSCGARMDLEAGG